MQQNKHATARRLLSIITEALFVMGNLNPINDLSSAIGDTDYHTDYINIFVRIPVTVAVMEKKH